MLRPRCASGLGFLWLILGVVALLVGIYGANPTLFALGMALIVPPLILAILLGRIARGLRLIRLAPACVHEGVEVIVEMRLENHSRWTCFFPRVSEIFPPEIHAQKDLILTDRLLPGESITARYSGYAIFPRGIYTIGPTAIRISDPFGWFEVRRHLEQRGELIVYPSLHDIPPLDRGGDAVATIIEHLTAREIGDEDELRGVREYRRGDSPRRIHWPLTARHRIPIVKEFHPVVTGDLHIVLDLHRRASAGSGRTSTVETAIRITGSIAREALRLGQRVSVVPGEQPERLVPLAGGTGQVRTILDCLVALRASEPNSLDAWLDGALDRIPRGSAALIFVSPYLMRRGAWLRAVESAVARGVRLVAVVFDESTYAPVWSDAIPELTTEQVEAELRRIGTIPITIACAGPGELEAMFAAHSRAEAS